jgi:hypothetical protein
MHVARKSPLSPLSPTKPSRDTRNCSMVTTVRRVGISQLRRSASESSGTARYRPAGGVREPPHPPWATVVAGSQARDADQAPYRPYLHRINEDASGGRKQARSAEDQARSRRDAKRLNVSTPSNPRSIVCRPSASRSSFSSLGSRKRIAVADRAIAHTEWPALSASFTVSSPDLRELRKLRK